jgi:nicotinate phosphoribosyltransferase
MSPTNSLVGPLLTDMYQISMTYGYWKNGKCEDHSVFDMFFRKNPFQGEYCVFAGLDECLQHCSSFAFNQGDIEFLKEIMSDCEEAFFDYLLKLNCSKVKIFAIDEGSLVYPKEPLMRVEGPLAIVQLLETTLLNLVNFPSLIATNACRMRLAAGSTKTLLEFGLRRAQGPDGGLSASKYSYLGGFDGSSNVLAGKLFGISVKGTHAHSFVMSYTALSELSTTKIASSADKTVEVEFLSLVLEKRRLLGYVNLTNEGELAAFIAYSQAFPRGLVALIDTYDTLYSGLPNFLSVGWALYELGYKPLGVRLDSGDLAMLSKEARKRFIAADALIGESIFAKCTIVASNDINEEVLWSLSTEGHEIDTFGIGTHLVTCQSQPALGCVFKLVEINGKSRIKLSQAIEKLTIPGRKSIYRLYGEDGLPIVDVIQKTEEPAPVVGVKMLVRHPFAANERAYVTPSRVKSLLNLVFDGAIINSCSLEEARTRCRNELQTQRSDNARSINPTPYKVYLSALLFDDMHTIWFQEAPVSEIK